MLTLAKDKTYNSSERTDKTAVAVNIFDLIKGRRLCKNYLYDKTCSIRSIGTL